MGHRDHLPREELNKGIAHAEARTATPKALSRVARGQGDSTKRDANAARASTAKGGRGR
jgi:hypothetical protein